MAKFVTNANRVYWWPNLHHLLLIRFTYILNGLCLLCLRQCLLLMPLISVMTGSISNLKKLWITIQWPNAFLSIPLHLKNALYSLLRWKIDAQAGRSYMLLWPQAGWASILASCCRCHVRQLKTPSVPLFQNSRIVCTINKKIDAVSKELLPL